MFHKPKRWTECMKVKLHIHETDASEHWTLNEFVGIHCLFNGIIASSSKWLKLRVRIHEPYKIQFNWFFVGLNYSSIRSEVECFLIHFLLLLFICSENSVDRISIAMKCFIMRTAWDETFYCNWIPKNE